MQVLNRASDGLKRDYTVLVLPEEIEEAFVRKLKEKAASVRMDGFRPGKVPLDFVKRLQGEQIRREAVQELVRGISQAIIKDEGVLISFDFRTSVIKDDEYGLEYSLKFEVIPSVDVTPVFAIELTKYVAEVTENEIGEILENVRKNRKKWIDLSEDGMATDGDRVSVSLKAKIKVRRNEENISTDMDIIVGDPNIVEDFWKPLVGKKAGDVVGFSVTYPKQINNKKLAGKTVDYTASIQKVARAGEYELDDELARDLGYADFSKLRDWAEKKCRARYEELSQSVLKRSLLEKMASLYHFDIPENMFKVEYADVHRQLLEEANRLGRPMSEEVEAGCRNLAESRVRLGFVVAELSKQNKISVSREEIVAAIRGLAAMYPGHEKAIWDTYSHGAALNAIIGPILERKVVEFLFKNIKVAEEQCTAKRLIEMDEETFDFFKDGSGVSVEKLQDIEKEGVNESDEGDLSKKVDSVEQKVLSEKID